MQGALDWWIRITPAHMVCFLRNTFSKKANNWNYAQTSISWL